MTNPPVPKPLECVVAIVPLEDEKGEQDLKGETPQNRTPAYLESGSRKGGLKLISRIFFKSTDKIGKLHCKPLNM